LRRYNPVSLTKAREALAVSNNSVQEALEWLHNDLEVSGAKKVAKVGGRETNQGLIGVSLMGTRAAMVEVRSETDFVARNEVFRNLVATIGSTVAFLDPPHGSPISPGASADYGESALIATSTADLANAPIISTDPETTLAAARDGEVSPPQSISQAITSAITQTGENIVFRRAVSFSSPISPTADPHTPFLLPGGYVHGAVKPGGNEGTVGGIVILSITSTTSSPITERIASDPTLGGELQKLARTIARQSVGFPTVGVKRPAGVAKVDDGEEGVSQYLVEQPFMMFGIGEERPVGEVLKEWGQQKDVRIEVKAVKRWSVGGDEE